MQASEKFWDDIFSKGQEGNYSRVEMPDIHDPILKRALAHFGHLENKTIIDLGCGRGATSLFFAHCGAHNVISVDLSDVAIKNLKTYCQDNDIDNITPMKLSAQEINKLEKVDFVFGSMILHHIEPFKEFAINLRDAIKPGGKCFFWENNAQSKIMIWFRQNIVGKLWVPKYGDPDEFPLTQSEVDELKKYFHVEVEFPELLYFRMISSYLFRGHFRKLFHILDNYFYKYHAFRKYSYRQYLCLSGRNLRPNE